MPTHMNDQEWYHYSNVPIESVNSWQVSHILRQHVAVRFQEWNMMKVEDYLQEKDTDYSSVQVQAGIPLV